MLKTRALCVLACAALSLLLITARPAQASGYVPSYEGVIQTVDYSAQTLVINGYHFKMAANASYSGIVSFNNLNPGMHVILLLGSPLQATGITTVTRVIVPAGA